MTKGQWKAVYDFCDEYGIPTSALLKTLKENGTVDRGTTLDELGEYVNGHTYNDMINFLEENV